MKLPKDVDTVPTEMQEKKKVKKIKSKKVKEQNGIPANIVAEALKKPRTRAVSLTLSENGINEDTSQVLQQKESSPIKVSKEKKVKKGIKKEGLTKEDVEAKDDVPEEHSAGRFSNFPIREKTIAKLHAKGIQYLFPVQVQTFQKVLEGNDVIAKARTGTGKTLAFALPLIEKLETGQSKCLKGRAPRVIVLAPTRELVNQVCKDFTALRSSPTLSIHAFYGGVSLHPQGEALRKGVDVLVGTPGRMLDWVNRGQLDTSKLEHVVLDEVDQMLDMGFADDVEQIISHSYKKDGDSNPQTLFFSATLPAWVKKTAAKYMTKMPLVIDLVGNSVNQTAKNVTHLAMLSHWKDHASDISKIIQYYSGDSGRAMVFCQTKRDVDELAMCSEIKQNKEKLHGDVKQSTRESVLQQFRAGTVKVLITTNVAARGLDIPEVDVVIQTNPPTDIDSYIHRSGRTGRAGKSGISVCLYSNRTEGDLIRVERFAKLSFGRVNVPSSDQLMSRGIKEILSSMGQITDEVIDRFRSTAEELISERGAVETAAILIAIATGQTTVRRQSLINSREGFVTYFYKTNATMKFKGYVYNVLRNRCGLETSNMFKNMTLTKDMQGAAFDLAEEEVAKVEPTLLFEGPEDSIVKATELPELQVYAPAPSDYSGPSRGGRNSFGGGGNRSNYGGFGGFKRSFGGGQSAGPMNKKTKFD